MFYNLQILILRLFDITNLELVSRDPHGIQGECNSPQPKNNLFVFMDFIHP
jgi:hypothetical protein